jgi:hypothetical protein
MGVAEINKQSRRLTIHACFYFYGEASSLDLCDQIARNIADHWNAPTGKAQIKKEWYDVRFNIEGFHDPDLKPETVWYNTNPRLNFFRIEEFSLNHISAVDGLNSNTGYFKLDNLMNNSTTAAHEFGHTLGLVHPKGLDIRGKGQPGIMYPRGTVCDPQFQYDVSALPLQPGGTLNPYLRKVLQSDIDDLRLQRLSFDQRNLSVIGDFSSLYHEKHLPPASQQEPS